MKKTILTLPLLIPITLLSQEVNKNISLAGDELMTYNRKQTTSIIVTGLGVGVMASTIHHLKDENVFYIGAGLTAVGIGIKIESLTNLVNSARHLKEDKKKASLKDF